MSESAMWKSIRPVLKPLDPVRIESPMTLGIPDVNYAYGWIELKYKTEWPPNGGPLRIKHFTKEQRTFLVNRRVAGGLAFVLLKVGKSEWLLFEGKTAAKHLGYENKEFLYKVVLARWNRLPRTEEIEVWLK